MNYQFKKKFVIFETGLKNVLRIDKGSRAACHVSRYSIGTRNSTVTIYIPYER